MSARLSGRAGGPRPPMPNSSLAACLKLERIGLSAGAVLCGDQEKPSRGLGRAHLSRPSRPCGELQGEGSGGGGRGILQRTSPWRHGSRRLEPRRARSSVAPCIRSASARFRLVLPGSCGAPSDVASRGGGIFDPKGDVCREQRERLLPVMFGGAIDEGRHRLSRLISDIRADGGGRNSGPSRAFQDAWRRISCSRGP